MLIQIRIVIEVPETDKDKFSVAIENIVQSVREQFPHLEVDKNHSPVTVFIKEFTESIDP